MYNGFLFGVFFFVFLKQSCEDLIVMKCKKWYKMLDVDDVIKAEERYGGGREWKEERKGESWGDKKR